jgi:dTDP-4-amino-4,6-dideoxygalactose transaminase
MTTPESVFHHYIAISENRTKSASLLKDQGVFTDIHYPKSAEKNLQIIEGVDIKGNSPKATELATKTISLPMSPWISEVEIDYVLDQISLESIRRSFLGEM